MSRAAKKPPTALQAEQRQLAWLLRITEGYMVNASRCEKVNQFLLSPPAYRLMIRAVNEAALTAGQLRNELERMKKRSGT